jgi:hypothetical protein
MSYYAELVEVGLDMSDQTWVSRVIPWPFINFALYCMESGS